jgi:2-phosphosulfolactate phosphatase
MTRRLRVLTTRHEINPSRLPGSTTVIIDVFMATTTLLTILENGARRVFASGSLAEVDALCGRLDRATLLRGGEQNALPVEGYDCGPYPDEYPPERVRGRDVVYVSTNGTAAIASAAGASRLLIASLRNAPAVAHYLERTQPDSIYLVCAGSGGRLALDDLAGAASILAHMDTSGWRLNDAAWLAQGLGREQRIPEMLRAARISRWFFENGREDMFRFITAVGASDAVPEVRDGQVMRVTGGVGALATGGAA